VTGQTVNSSVLKFYHCLPSLQSREKNIERSKKAIDALGAFKERGPRNVPSIPEFIRQIDLFFTDKFKVDIDPNALPQHSLLETAKEQELRQSVTSCLMKEFAAICSDYRDKDEDVPATLLYWYLSKHH
jgi:hypothetical protein